MKPLTNIKNVLILFFPLLVFNLLVGQEIIEDEDKTATTTVQTSERKKVDGVIGVVGDFIILDSDIDKSYIEIEQQGGDVSQIDRCQLFGKLLEDKLYLHHAIQDSITIDEVNIRAENDQRISMFLNAKDGSMKELLKTYNLNSEAELKEKMFEQVKNNQLTVKMQRSVIDDIEATPEEVRNFFNKIPKDSLPIFGTELKVAQIVVNPKISKEEKQVVIDKLKTFKKEIEEGASFSAKATLYSDDTPSRKTGGKYTLHKKRPQMVKPLRDAAFSLDEGQISDPFETIYGYHIVYVEKIRGYEYDIRHILLRPEVTQKSLDDAREKLELIRKRIVDGDISFANAAKEYSDEIETKNDGGQLINPSTQDFNFELTKMDPELYAQIQNLKNNEVSLVLEEQDRIGLKKYKIITVTDRIDEHKADFAKDYTKIKQFTIQEKQFKALEKWQNDKIKDTYVVINEAYHKCDFKSNWLKK